MEPESQAMRGARGSASLPPWHRWLERVLARTRHGALEIRLPDGGRVTAQGPLPGPQAVLAVNRWRTLPRVLGQGDAGLGFAYRDGDWSSPDLPALLAFGMANEAAFGAVLHGNGLAGFVARIAHLARRNSRRGSRDNIAFHYDLGNLFYGFWLDERMQYSSGLYRTGDESLDVAQAAKLDRIIELLDARPGHRVLEIGCGWGGMATTLAQRVACSVRGISLSAAQIAHARERAAQLDVSERVTFGREDYRDSSGRFERLLSIEMVEAVGERYWPVYFGTLKARLAAGGRIVLQAITIDEAHFGQYRKRADFIQRAIFPGGMLPTATAIRDQAMRAGLVVEHVETFGPSYAATLVEWRRRFLAAWPEIRALGFDERFRRLWDYYLCYCEAGFRSGRVDVGLYVLRHG